MKNKEEQVGEKERRAGMKEEEGQTDKNKDNKVLDFLGTRP